MNQELQKQFNDLYFGHFDDSDYQYFRDFANQHKSLLPDIAEKPMFILEGTRELYSQTNAQFIEGTNKQIHSAYGVQKGDSLFLTIHGTPDYEGHVVLGKWALKPQQVIDYIEEKQLIPEGIKNIYTMSCHGGLQQPFETKSGIRVESAHTSPNTLVATGLATPEGPDIINYGGVYFYASEGHGLSENAMKSLISNVKEPNKVVFSYNDFHQILQGEKTYRDLPYFNPKAKVEIPPTNITSGTATVSAKANIVQPKTQTLHHKTSQSFMASRLTSQEAFQKYGPNDDRFYTSQGLNPAQQKAAINKLNAQRKPVDNTPIEVKEFQQKLKQLGVTESEYYRRLEQEWSQPISSPRKQRTYRRGPKLKQPAPTITKTTKPTNTLPAQKVAKPVQETTERVVQKTATQVTNKVAQVSKTLPKKTLGSGGKMAIGMAVAGLAIGGIIAASDNKPKKQKQQRPAKATPRTTQYTMQQPIDNQYAQQMAQDISSYRYGKHMTGFVNF